MSIPMQPSLQFTYLTKYFPFGSTAYFVVLFYIKSLVKHLYACEYIYIYIYLLLHICRSISVNIGFIHIGIQFIHISYFHHRYKFYCLYIAPRIFSTCICIFWLQLFHQAAWHWIPFCLCWDSIYREVY